MVRDISERLRMFGCKRVRVQKIALTMPQVEEHEPPPNPAKMTDARAPAYVEKHGDLSWEVDALDPDTLQGLIRAALSGVLDREKFDAMIEREAQEKARLRARRALTIDQVCDALDFNPSKTGRELLGRLLDGEPDPE